MKIFREYSAREARSRLKGVAALIVCCLLMVSHSTHAREFAYCTVSASNGIDLNDITDTDYSDPVNFPVELKVPIWKETPYNDPLLPWGAWCYANEEGRVRGSVVTGISDESPLEARVWTQWGRFYVRDSNAPMPDFTVNESHLLIESDPINLGGELAEPMFAEMFFEVRLNNKVIFEHRSRMSGVPGQPSFKFEENTDGDIVMYYKANGEPLHPATIGTKVDQRDGFAEYILPRYHQEIDLNAYGIADGDKYHITYTLEVSAGETLLAESRAEAFLGDPLDAGTGFVLNVADPVSPSSEIQCESLPDPGRYANNGDGTVTDARTGLMWQQCPAGYALDDAGTADTSDDSCAANGGGDGLLDWQAALQAAVAMPGYDDWRSPNIKELESLLETGCIAAVQIDPLAFPGIPPSAYWSATPEPGGSASPRRAWQLNLFSGDIYPAARDSDAYLLAVRHSGELPVAPAVAVTAGDADVLEGDAGQRVLSLPVALSHATTLPVTVDYLVRGLGATNGVDFDAVAGTLTIAAGDTRGQVDVQVHGDTDVESNELVELELNNVSAPAWLRRDTGFGRIIDDEPIMLVGESLEVAEGNADSVLDVTVNLDRPAQATLSVDYSTSSIMATEGLDYIAASGTLVFQPGDSDAVIPVTIRGDLVEETAEQFGIDFSNANGAVIIGDSMTLLVNIMDNDGPGTYAALNDTGVSQCANGTQALVACPQAGYPGQDAEFGRDVTNNDDADGALGFSFNKMDDTGTALINQAALYSQEPWDCVEDQVTGLFWEVKSDQATDLRYFDHTYTWYNSSGSNDGGDAGTANGGVCAAGQSCDTESYVAAVNAAGLCGYSDWREPSAEELFSIAWLSADSISGLDTRYFPNHFAPGDGRGYWSATPVADDASSALRVRMDASFSQSTSLLPSAKSATQRIRLVRGGVPLAQP